MRGRVLVAGVASLVFACVGTTGGELVSFSAAAAGPADAQPGMPLAFTTGAWHVVLAKAILHIGAVYLDQSLPVSGSQGTSCIFPGTYVAQVTTGRDVDLLSPTPQPFPVQGQGTTLPQALVGQIWLTCGNVNEEAQASCRSGSSANAILIIAGTADDLNGTSVPFEGTITIGTNRQATGAQAAGSDPICKERIVSIPTNVTVQATGGLLVRVDPRQLFNKVDFSQLTKLPDGNFGFSDDPSSASYTQPSRNLYQNLRSAGAVYSFTWSDQL
ncbi:MAG: hypothetical protein ACRENE_18185 [Polyangiaceae bacterium]